MGNKVANRLTINTKYVSVSTDYVLPQATLWLLDRIPLSSHACLSIILYAFSFFTTYKIFSK